jgi:phosphorylcholine metabolism protein LicD
MSKSTKKSEVKKVLKRELSNRNKYKTTYKDIKKYFNIINTAIFNKKLSPFNEIKIKEIRDGRPNGKYCYGQVTIYSWKRKGTVQYHLEMLPSYRNKKEFVDTLGHEMVHLYQMANVGDTGNHNKLFYSFRPKLNRIGLDL